MVDQEAMCIPNLLMSIGIGLLTWGILIRLGISKTWFVTISIPPYSIRSAAFGLIPIGMAAFLFGLLGAGRVSGWIGEDAGLLWLKFGVFPLMALGLILAIWQPRWILPDWYRWLRDNYGDIMPQLREHAQKMDLWAWRENVRSQEGLAQWAAEVRYKPWLESRYDPDVVAFMLAEARLDDGWTERVSTEAGLVAWAGEMAARYRERRQASKK
jgi:hypothetical protein